MNYDIVYRAAERLAVCRGCDTSLPKGSPLIYTYSQRNRGQNIFFCIPCAKEIGRLADTQLELFDEEIKAKGT